MHVFSQALSLNPHEVLSPGQGFVPQKCQNPKWTKNTAQGYLLFSHWEKALNFPTSSPFIDPSGSSSIYWSIHFLTHLLIHPLPHLFIDPSGSSLIYWSNSFFTHLLIHPFPHPFIDPSTSSPIYWFILFFTHFTEFTEFTGSHCSGNLW